MKSRIILTASLVALTVLAAAIRNSAAEEFYRGKNIRFIVGVTKNAH